MQVKKKRFGKREMSIITIVSIVLCDIWINMEQWGVSMVAGGTAGGQPQQGTHVERSQQVGT